MANKLHWIVVSEPRTLRIYSTQDGRRPFQDWIDSLTDYDGRSRVWARINRVRLGSLGDWKSVGEGVHEMRIDVGPGYRIYLGQDGKSLVILLCGGTKATQGADIANAKRYWQDYRSRKDAEKRTIR